MWVFNFSSLSTFSHEYWHVTIPRKWRQVNTCTRYSLLISGIMIHSSACVVAYILRIFVVYSCIQFSTYYELYVFNNPKDCAVAVAQSVKDSHRKQKVGCSNPSLGRTESLRQGLLTPLPSA